MKGELENLQALQRNVQFGTISSGVRPPVAVTRQLWDFGRIRHF